MRARTPLAFLAPFFALSGCATGAFQQVNFAAEGAPVPKADPKSQTVYVVPNAQMKDTILDARIRAKLEAFLLTRGYVLSTPEKAELYVLATFGTGKRLVASEASVFKPAEVAVVRDRQGNPIRRAYTPERMQSLRVPTFENSIWLQVLSSDANYFRETGMVRNLWRGEAAMKGDVDAVPSAVPYLLVPALKFFGQPTRQVVTMDVREKDIAWHDEP
jgi:hypothetical protein